MIVKILSSASNFAGIHYNERKNDAGESELLCAENFGSLALNSNPTKADYVNYLKSFSSSNTRIKNIQFHAVISAKGKDYPLDKLSDIGVQYLQAMGYGSNPYLIYHHLDTRHRHIHMISTRVDGDGKKVDDRFEKLRSQKVMHEILMRDPLYEADQCLADAMKYQFSTMAQFKLLLELKGFKVNEVGGKLSMIKYGSVQRSLDAGAIEQRINAYGFPKKRAGQLKSIIRKYAIDKIDDQWADFMKKKFGLDIIFHRKQGYDTPYGYTVIDHPEKTVFKGSQILPLPELLSTPQEKKITELVCEMAKLPNLSFNHFQRELSKLGVRMHANGFYSWSLGKGQLSLVAIQKLRYTERLQIANSFKINDRSCKSLLGKFLIVNPAELTSSVLSNQKFEAHRAAMEYLDQSNRWEDGLTHFNYRLLRDDQRIFLFIPAEPALIQVEKLLGRPPSVSPGLIPHIHTMADRSTNNELLGHSSKESILEALIGIMAEAQQGPKEDKNTKKPARRRSGKTIKL
jgi:hypothetical protein